jgi:hypothetical protein
VRTTASCSNTSTMVAEENDFLLKCADFPLPGATAVEERSSLAGGRETPPPFVSSAGGDGAMIKSVLPLAV